MISFNTEIVSTGCTVENLYVVKKGIVKIIKKIEKKQLKNLKSGN